MRREGLVKHPLEKTVEAVQQGKKIELLPWSVSYGKALKSGTRRKRYL